MLMQHEAEHNLMLSLCSRALQAKSRSEPYDIWFAAVSYKNQLAMIAMQAPPHNLVLSRAYQADAEEVLVKMLAERGLSFPGIVGPSDVTANFINAWSKITRQETAECMDQIIYSLKKVLMPPSVEGRLRFARPEEYTLIGAWMKAFCEDALPKADHITLDKSLTEAQKRIADKTIVVWDVQGTPVAMAGLSGTDSLSRISLVYTPAEHRGRGYASSVVAHLSQHELDQGKKMCCLYADARNPVSNSIYRKIGYEFVGRSSHYVLSSVS